MVNLKNNASQLLQAWMEIYGELTPELQERFLTHKVVLKLAWRESPEMVWPCLKKHKKLDDIYACVQLSDETTNVARKEYIRKSRSRSIAKSLNPTSGGEKRPLRKSREPLKKEMRQRATPDFDERNREPYL